MLKRGAMLDVTLIEGATGRRKLLNRSIASWKRRMRLMRLTRFGLAKARAEVLLTAMAFNLSRAAALSA